MNRQVADATSGERGATSCALGQSAAAKSEFGRVAGAAFLADTLLVVADAQNLRLDYFTLQGKLLRTLGRRGSGPGEFASIGKNVTSLADTAVIYDNRLSRFSLFSAGGQFVRAIVLEDVAFVDNPIALLPSGRYLASSLVSRVPTSQTETVLRFDTLELQIRNLQDGNVLARLGRVPGLALITNTTRGLNVLPQPFSRPGQYAVTAEGILILSGDSVIRRFNNEGDELASLASPWTPKRPARADTERWIEYHNRPSQNPAFGKEMYSHSVAPPLMPAYGPSAVDRLGNVWLAEYLPPYAQSPSLVRRLSMNGAESPTIRLESSAVLIAASPYALAFLMKDTLDVESVMIYTLLCS